MIFDLYQDGKSTKRVMSISSTAVLDLKTLKVIENIDFENEAGCTLIYNIFEYEL